MEKIRNDPAGFPLSIVYGKDMGFDNAQVR